MLLVHWLSKVAKNTILEHTGLDIVITVCGHENCRNREIRILKVSVELNAGHCRHVHVRDQAGSLAKTIGCEEIGCRCESLNSIAQRPHERSHRLTKKLVIFNDRDQQPFRHTGASRSSFEYGRRARRRCRYRIKSV